MALLSFPPTPYAGEIYPVNPPPLTNIYLWDSADQTWVLLGKSTGVVAGVYGTPTAVPEITIDATGRITVAQNLPIQLGDTTQVGLVQLVDDTISDDPTKALTAAQGYRLQNEIGDTSQLNPFYPNLVTAINAINAPTGVTAGTYGTGTAIAQFIVNAQGRITSATNVPLALATTTSPGVIRVGANLNVTGLGVLSVPNSSTTVRGAVQIGNNISVSPSGVISVPPATTVSAGVVQPDGTTITVSPTGVISASSAGVGTLQQVTDLGAATTNAITVGGLTSTGNVVIGDSPSDTVTVFSRVASALIPSVNETYDLGLPTNRWRDLYVSSNSIYMGANQLTVSGGQLLLNGTPVGGGGSVGTLQQVTTAGNTTSNSIIVSAGGYTSNLAPSSLTLSNPGGFVQPATTALVTGGGITLTVSGGSTTMLLDSASGRATVTSLLTGAGTTATPSIAFTSAPTTGFNANGGNLEVSVAGSSRMVFASGGTGITGGLSVGSLVAAGLTYPTTDGTSGQVLTTNGAGVLSWASGSGAVSTLQQVTTAGNTTNQPMRFYDAVSTNESVRIEPDTGLISIFPQSLGDPGFYISPTGPYFGNSTGSFYAAGLVPASLDFNGSAGTSIKTATPTVPVQLWAGGQGGVTIPQVSVTGTTTTVNNNLKVEGYIQVTPNGIRFYESSAVDYVGLNAPTSLGASYNLTLPPADGTADQVLATDGTGDLQWLTTAKIVAVPASSASGGAAGQIAFGNGFFYWFNTATNQWLRVAGSTF